MSTLSHHEITVFLISLAVVLATARILGEVARRLGQPAVIGELIAGILLGPTALGALWPGANRWLFPEEGPIPYALNGMTSLAIILFLLVAGMEVDLSTIWRRKTAALTIGLGGMIVPFVFGLVPAWAAPVMMGAEPGSPTAVFALFFATALSISALPVVAKLLMDLHLFRTDIGMTIVAAAVFNDIVGWLIFALVLAMIGLDTGAGLPIWQTVLVTLGFAAGMLTVGRWLIDRSLPWVQAHTGWPGGVLGFALVLAVLCAAFTEWLGVHAIFGAFIFGVALGDSRHLRANTRGTIDQFVSFIFAPLFFATIGLRVNFATNFDIVLVGVVLILATFGKVIGCLLSARLIGVPRAEAWAIGFGLNARGAMEIILGLLALETGLIGERLFVALVVMALVTSITSGPLIQAVLGRVKQVRFASFATPKTFLPNITRTTRPLAIAEVAALAADAAGLPREDLERRVLAREQLVGSALGNGVAVPQVRLPGLAQPVVAIGISRRGVEFGAPAALPVRIVILLVTPAEEVRLQLALLADIARTFQDPNVVDAAVEAGTWTEFLAVLNAAAPAPHGQEPAPA